MKSNVNFCCYITVQTAGAAATLSAAWLASLLIAMAMSKPDMTSSLPVWNLGIPQQLDKCYRCEIHVWYSLFPEKVWPVLKVFWCLLLKCKKSNNTCICTFQNLGKELDYAQVVKMCSLYGQAGREDALLHLLTLFKPGHNSTSSVHHNIYSALLDVYGECTFVNVILTFFGTENFQSLKTQASTPYTCDLNSSYIKGMSVLFYSASLWIFYLK